MFVTLTVGVPAMAPVEALSNSPVGNVPLVKVHVKGEVPPVATSVVLYAKLICPLGREVVVMTSVAGGGGS